MGWFGSKSSKDEDWGERPLEECFEESYSRKETAIKEVKKIIATGDVEELIRALETPNRKGVALFPATDPGGDCYSEMLRECAALALGNITAGEKLTCTTKTLQDEYQATELFSKIIERYQSKGLRFSKENYLKQKCVALPMACHTCGVNLELERSSEYDIGLYPKRNCSCEVDFDPRAVEALIQSLDIEQYEGLGRYNRLRDKIVQALGEIGDERALEPLSKMLKRFRTEKDNISILSAGALRNIGGTQAFNSLFKEFIKLPLPPAVEQGTYNERTDPKRTYGSVAEALKKFPETANEFERLELYDKAEEWYRYHGMLEEAAAIRRKKADMAAPKTEIHGDYVDDRDTIIKDSVVSKSNIGAGGKSKAEELREAKALLDEGLINEDDYEQMKKEILGK